VTTNYDYYDTEGSPLALGTALVKMETQELVSEDKVQDFKERWENSSKNIWVSIRKQHRENPDEEFYNCIAYTRQARE
jgi:hypothetical protein